MLDFSEAVGRMILDRSFRSTVFIPELKTIVSETKSSIEFPAASYATIRKILNSNLSQHSYSLATDGEVIRLVARPKLAAHVAQLAALAEKHRDFASPKASYAESAEVVAGSTSTAFATALGALTLDQELRGEFLAAPGPIPEIPGLSSADIVSLQRTMSDSAYVAEANALCFDGWAEGCFSRLRYYFQYNHPELKP